MNETYPSAGKGVTGRDNGNGSVAHGRGKGVVTAALVGAGVGAGVALLFAPCSGKETRGWLADRSRQLKDKTTSAFEQGKDVTRRAAREIGRVAEEAGNSVDRSASIGLGTKNLPR